MPCEYCTRILHTGEAKILVAFTVKELVKIIEDTQDIRIQERMLKAIGLLDAELERLLRE
jgi:hypothetical protein